MQNCYVIQRGGLFYKMGDWVSGPPFEIFIPPGDGGMDLVENIAHELGGKLVELDELGKVVPDDSKQDRHGNGPIGTSQQTH